MLTRFGFRHLKPPSGQEASRTAPKTAVIATILTRLCLVCVPKT